MISPPPAWHKQGFHSGRSLPGFLNALVRRCFMSASLGVASVLLLPATATAEDTFGFSHVPIKPN